MADASIETSALLSERARSVDPDTIAAHRVVAESLLAVAALLPLVTAQADKDKYEAAMALQISYQIEQGIEGALLADARRGSRSFTYRVRGELRNKATHRNALIIITELKTRLGVY